MSVLAREVSVRLTSRCGAFEFIAAVAAVVVAVTDPTLLDALAVTAGKLVRTTRFICTFTFSILWVTIFAEVKICHDNYLVNFTTLKRTIHTL